MRHITFMLRCPHCCHLDRYLSVSSIRRVGKLNIGTEISLDPLPSFPSTGLKLIEDEIVTGAITLWITVDA